jgi:hypothetical protein
MAEILWTDIVTTNVPTETKRRWGSGEIEKTRCFVFFDQWNIKRIIEFILIIIKRPNQFVVQH